MNTKNYKSVDEIRQAIRTEYEEKYPAPTLADMFQIERPRLIRIGNSNNSGFIWLEVRQNNYYGRERKPEIVLFLKGTEGTGNNLALEELDAFINELQAAKRNYEALALNGNAEQKYKDALADWEKGLEAAQRRAVSNWRKSHNDKSTDAESQNGEGNEAD